MIPNGEEQIGEQEVREGQGRRETEGWSDQRLLWLDLALQPAPRKREVLVSDKPTPDQLEYLCKIFYADRCYREDQRLIEVADMLMRCDIALELSRASERRSQRWPVADATQNSRSVIRPFAALTGSAL